MILKKGTTLYHISDEPFRERTDKPMLFTTFHPSDFSANTDEYVTRITLKRDVSLLFMVGEIRGRRILSLLDTLTGLPGHNLAKMYTPNLICYVDYLRAENFDGWFSTINGMDTVEVALINSGSMFEITSSDQIPVKNWMDGSYNSNNSYIPKRWSRMFPLTTFTYPVQLTINERYKPQIEEYMKRCERNCPTEHTFHAILKTASIRYLPYPLERIQWNCTVRVHIPGITEP